MGRTKATLCFILVSAAVTLWLESLSPEARETQVLTASTNLDNLGHGHLLTLVTSAFVRDGEAGLWPLVAVALLMGGVELLWSSRRLVGVFAAGHVLATLVVAAGLAVGEALRWLPPSWTSASDVGLSYGVMGLAGALTFEWPGVVRPLWAAGWLALDVSALLHGRTFTDAGHVCALLIGLAAGAVLRRGERARPASHRPILVVVAGALAWVEWGGPNGILIGLAGAAAAAAVLAVSRDQPSPVGD